MGRFLFSVIFLFSLIQPALAAEVSEVTVDFPLSEILDIKTVGPNVSDAGKDSSPATNVKHASWEDEWFAYRQKSLRGNNKGASEHLDSVNAYRLSAGIPNLFIPSAALMYESAQARKQGRFDDALRLVNYASLLSPDDPAPHFYRARTLWKQNRLRILSAVDAVFEGWVTFARDFRSAFPWMVGFAAWVLTGVIIASIVSIFIYAIRIIPRISHDISHLIRLPQWVISLSFPLLMALLLFIWLPFIWWVVAVGFIPFFHASGRERVALAFGLILLVCIPLLVHVMALGNNFNSGFKGLVLYEAEMSGEGPATIRKLETLRTRYPRDPEVLVAMAAVLRRDDNIEGARGLLKKAAIMSPESAVVINNAANLLYAKSKISAAIDQYKKALRYKDNAIIHYNLSLALQENLQLEEGGREFQKAQSMNADLINKITTTRPEGAKSIVQDIFPDRKTFFLSALKLDDLGRQWRNTMWGGVLPWVSFAFALIGFPLAGILMLAGYPLGKAFFSSSRCRRCGRLHCNRCSESAKDELCSQCRQIFFVRTGVDPASRVRKMMQIMRFNKRRSITARVLTVILPGSGHAFLGDGLKAVVLVSVSAVFWLKWMLWYGLYRSTTILEIQPGTSLRVVFAVFFLVYYIFVFRSLGQIMEER